MGSDQATADGDTPKLSDDFWLQLEIQQACREQHFGHLLKSYRELQNPILTQGELARLLSLTQGQVSRIERSLTPVSNLNKLSRWSHALKIPQSVLWFQLHILPSDSFTSVSSPSIIEGKLNETEGEDMRRRDLIKSISVGAALLGTSGLKDIPVEAVSDSRAVGMETIEIMREWTRTFRHVDNRFGGGHSLSQIGHYLSIDIAPKIKDARCNEAVRRELFSAASELYQLAGWMSYDTGNADQGRKCLSRALRLSQEVGNRAFAAELLAGMSHQASFLRKSEDAVDFALAAKEIARKIGMPALASEASVMAAHGLAQQGDKRACVIELKEAEAEFCRIRSEEIPDWLSYFDEAYLSAKFGHTLKDLGEAQEAERFARRSLQMIEGFDRGRLFNTALLSSTLADQGRVDEAITYGQRAVQMTGSVRSIRTSAYLTDVAERLLPFQDDRGVRGLYKQMSANKIPLRRV